MHNVNVNVVEKEIAKGKEMLSRSFVNNDYAKQEIPSDLDGYAETLFRYSLFTEYRNWVTKVAQLGLSKMETIMIYAEVKRAAYRGLARYRDGYKAPEVNVAEEVAVVTEEVAELKALVAQLNDRVIGLTAEKAALIDAQTTTMNELMQIKSSMRLKVRLGLTTKICREVVANVVSNVVSKVEIKSNFR